MPIHLFIDTNIYLSFYHFSNDDLEELKKLKTLIATDKVILYITEQVKDEFSRNRENKLSDAIKRLNEGEVEVSMPTFSKVYPLYSEIAEEVKEIKKKKQKLIDEIKQDISDKKLKADEIINELFEKAEMLEMTNDNIISKSKTRYDLGNPPGKGKSYGDALNWEILLNKFISKDNEGNPIDLHFISVDKDYNSLIDNNKFNSFLLDEWKEKKGSEIKYYKNLSSFVKSNFPNIKLVIDFERNQLIDNFINSFTFRKTRYNLYSLLERIDTDSFTKEDVSNIVEASLNNSQIFWISQDEDINKMLYDIVEVNKEKLSEDLLNEFYRKIPKV